MKLTSHAFISITNLHKPLLPSTRYLSLLLYFFEPFIYQFDLHGIRYPLAIRPTGYDVFTARFTLYLTHGDLAWSSTMADERNSCWYFIWLIISFPARLSILCLAWFFVAAPILSLCGAIHLWMDCIAVIKSCVCTILLAGTKIIRQTIAHLRMEIEKGSEQTSYEEVDVGMWDIITMPITSSNILLETGRPFIWINTLALVRRFPVLARCFTTLADAIDWIVENVASETADPIEPNILRESQCTGKLKKSCSHALDNTTTSLEQLSHEDQLEAPTTFHLFSHLPTELQDRIFSAALTSTRKTLQRYHAFAHRPIFSIHAKIDPENPQFTHFWKRYWISRNHPLLHATHNSRKETQRHARLHNYAYDALTDSISIPVVDGLGAPYKIYCPDDIVFEFVVTCTNPDPATSAHPCTPMNHIWDVILYASVQSLHVPEWVLERIVYVHFAFPECRAFAQEGVYGSEWVPERIFRFLDLLRREHGICQFERVSLGRGRWSEGGIAKRIWDVPWARRRHEVGDKDGVNDVIQPHW
jgi:hypothetical protein